MYRVDETDSIGLAREAVNTTQPVFSHRHGDQYTSIATNKPESL